MKSSAWTPASTKSGYSIVMVQQRRRQSLGSFVQVEVADLNGVEAVIQMAGLSSDPAGQLAPHIIYEINGRCAWGSLTIIS
jgi:hypothetical protein